MQLSILICTYNREKYLIDALNSIAQQNASYDLFELVVINNNSTDNTEKICRDFKDKHKKLNYKYTIEKKQGLSAARNKGIRVANGELLAYIDDDAIADKNYVNNILEAFNKHPDILAIGGRVIPVFPDGNEPKWLSKYLNGIISKVDYGEKIKLYKGKYPSGCNMIFRKKVFDIVGTFNEDLTWRSDDKYMFLKIYKYKLPVLYYPGILVHHNIDSYRLEYNYLKKLSETSGTTERVRLQ